MMPDEDNKVLQQWRSKALMRENRIVSLLKEIEDHKWTIETERRKTRLLDSQWKNLYYSMVKEKQDDL